VGGGGGGGWGGGGGGGGGGGCVDGDGGCGGRDVLIGGCPLCMVLSGQSRLAEAHL
jgi:hypothetical protein